MTKRTRRRFLSASTAPRPDDNWDTIMTMFPARRASRWHRTLAICIGLLAALPLPLRALAQRVEPNAFRHEIKPGKIAEECRNLVPDERVRYRFEASAAVPFNVHFHRGNTVEYPVKIDKTTDAASILTAPSAQDFCWMWTNETADTVIVHGELVRMK